MHDEVSVAVVHALLVSFCVCMHTCVRMYLCVCVLCSCVCMSIACALTREPHPPLLAHVAEVVLKWSHVT